MPSPKMLPAPKPTKTPNLKSRAAGLKAGLLRLTARPAIPSLLPAPGSAESVAAYEAALSEFDRLTSLSEAEYAALRIGDSFTLWTTSGVEAAQRGDFSRFTMREMGAVRSKTPAELADLLVITARRALQFAEAQRQTGLRTLYALAYPNGEDEAPDLDPEGDYAHLIIAEHRAAYAAFKPLNDAWNNAKGREAFDAAERALEEPHRVHAEAYGNLIDTQPSTLAGLVALAGYVPETVRVNNEDDADSDAARALRGICNSVLKLAESGQITIAPKADPDDRGGRPAPEPSPVLAAMVADWAETFRRYNDVTEEDQTPEGDALFGRICTLQPKIYAFPVATTADLCAKLPVLRDEFADINVGPDPTKPYLLRQATDAVLRDLEALSRAAPSSEAIVRRDLDLKAMSLRELASVHDVAVLIKDVAHAVSCQPRCASHQPYPASAHNVVGEFVSSIAEALVGLESDALDEMRSRVPTDRLDCERRLQFLAEATVANGDSDQITSFAHELLATVET